MAMGTLPEEFPIVLTIFLTMGAWRLARNQVLTRRPATIETLGSTTVLCVDKTGTLTENKMSFALLYTSDGRKKYKRDLEHSSVKELIRIGVLASQQKPFDPMEIAFINAGREYFGNGEIHENLEIVKEYTLEKYSLAVAHIWRDPNKEQHVIAAKGAPEAILDLCHIDTKESQLLLEEAKVMAGEGLRVLGVARGKSNKLDVLPENKHEIDFEFLGFVGLEDPIRPEIAQAVIECKQAGVRVVMITGDYPATAQNIAKQIGLDSPGGVITGPELDKMTVDELAERIKNVNLFSRVVPEQKLLIVNALKKNGEVVAMTGDGVNDAPALKAAHIGIAMGKHGTDVAREAAGIVLLDDNFTSIVGGIRLGRKIYDNLGKAMTYIFAVHIPIIGLSLLPVLLGWPLILTPMLIVFLELIIDPACTVVFENEKEDEGIMQRKPRKISEPIFNRKMISISLVQGLVSLVITAFVYYLSTQSGFGPEKARAITFTTLVASNIGLILTNRSYKRTLWNSMRTSANRPLLIVTLLASTFLVATIYIPDLRALFNFEVLSLVEFIFAILAGLTVMICFEIGKLLKRSKDR
jgi:Ca2+-transporting ATPase